MFIEIIEKYLNPAFYSCFRVVVGFSMAAFSSILLALLLSEVVLLRKMFQIIVDILKPISPLAWVPVGLILFGTGDASALFVVFIASFFPIFLNSLNSFVENKNVNNEFQVIFGLNSFQKLVHITIPASLPKILVRLKIGLATGWMSIVAAEQMGISTGLGTQIQVARFSLDTQKLVLTMLTIGIFGFVLNSILGTLEKTLPGVLRKKIVN